MLAPIKTVAAKFGLLQKKGEEQRPDPWKVYRKTLKELVSENAEKRTLYLIDSLCKYVHSKFVIEGGGVDCEQLKDSIEDALVFVLEMRPNDDMPSLALKLLASLFGTFYISYMKGLLEIPISAAFEYYLEAGKRSPERVELGGAQLLSKAVEAAAEALVSSDSERIVDSLALLMLHLLKHRKKEFGFLVSDIGYPFVAFDEFVMTRKDAARGKPYLEDMVFAALIGADPGLTSLLATSVLTVALEALKEENIVEYSKALKTVDDMLGGRYPRWIADVLMTAKSFEAIGGETLLKMTAAATSAAKLVSAKSNADDVLTSRPKVKAKPSSSSLLVEEICFSYENPPVIELEKSSISVALCFRRFYVRALSFPSMFDSIRSVLKHYKSAFKVFSDMSKEIAVKIELNGKGSQKAAELASAITSNLASVLSCSEVKSWCGVRADGNAVEVWAESWTQKHMWETTALALGTAAVALKRAEVCGKADFSEEAIEEVMLRAGSALLVKNEVAKAVRLKSWKALAEHAKENKVLEALKIVSEVLLSCEEQKGLEKREVQLEDS